jgi:hypothetical protein
MCENGTDAKLPQESDLQPNKNFISFEPIPLIMKPFSALFLATIVLSSCHSLSGPPATDRLTPTAIYNIDSVRPATGSGDDKIARKQLAAAINAYKNEKDPGKSIPLFKQSILTKPNAQVYYELGCALLDHRDDSEAVLALHIAEKLEYKPLANVMYKLSAAYAVTVAHEIHPPETNDSLATHYMELAIQMGYARPESFRNDPAFKNFRNAGIFNVAYLSAVEGGHNVKKPELALWEEFKSEFSAIELPLTINTGWTQTHAPDKDINFAYERFVPEMRNNRFAREAGKEYFYVGLLKKDTAYTALLYAGKDEGLEEDGIVHAPLFFQLVTYDSRGKIIDHLKVAGQETFSDLVKVFTIQPNNTFEIRDFKNVYSKDPEQAGYGADNPIVKTDEQGVTHYRITATGKFETTETPLAIR